jgi:hypothetical protein
MNEIHWLWLESIVNDVSLLQMEQKKRRTEELYLQAAQFKNQWSSSL